MGSEGLSVWQGGTGARTDEVGCHAAKRGPHGAQRQLLPRQRALQPTVSPFFPSKVLLHPLVHAIRPPLNSDGEDAAASVGGAVRRGSVVRCGFTSSAVAAPTVACHAIPTTTTLRAALTPCLHQLCSPRTTTSTTTRIGASAAHTINIWRHMPSLPDLRPSWTRRQRGRCQRRCAHLSPLSP